MNVVEPTMEAARMTAGWVRRIGRRGRSIAAQRMGAPVNVCPICGFHGSFVVAAGGIDRPRALCPRCDCAERHRLVRMACEGRELPFGTTLHFAPERHLGGFFRSISARYLTADLVRRRRIDFQLDVTALGVRSRSVDLLVAIHVLEHVKDDGAALAEFARLLTPGGVAVIAVPVVAPKTVEYSAPNPHEHLHVRAPGLDWYERLHANFSDVEIVSSADVSDNYQPWVYEDRTGFPTGWAPERPAHSGLRHPDFVAFASL